ncbi:MAG: PH domain-containing protein [Acidobacteriota bacterium]
MNYVKRLLPENEQILFLTRRHGFVLLKRSFKESLILAALVVGLLAIRRLPDPTYGMIAIAVVAAVVLLSILFDVLRWQNEQFIVTNRRVISCSGIFNKNVLDSSLNKINDVILRQSWLGRVFGYGTIEILTASEEATNVLATIANPLGFKQAMLNAKAGLEDAVPAPAASPSATQLLEELAQLKARGLISEAEYQEKRKEILKRI